jgi:hypothetical protein
MPGAAEGVGGEIPFAKRDPSGIAKGFLAHG